MEKVDVKILENCVRVVDDPKRKRLLQDDNLSDHSDDSMRLAELDKGYPSDIKSSISKNYSNFIKSSSLQRLLYFWNCEWEDYPADIINLVREDFQTKKIVTEVPFQGHRLLFDFEHMVQIDLDTHLYKRIAWIDENGNCFFPDMFSVTEADESHGYVHRATREYEAEPRMREINMQPEIPTSPAESSTLSEGNRNLVSKAKRPRFEEPCQLRKMNTDQKESIEENKLSIMFPLKDQTLGPLHAILFKLTSSMKVYSIVHDLLLLGLRQFIHSKDIVGIFQIPHSVLGQNRVELFKKQVDITRNIRGNSNVRFGWLAASREELKDIILDDLRKIDMPKCNPMFGIGVHFSPPKHSYISASYSNVDEGGIVHMVFCRIILGKLELVPPGSKQFQPSTDFFDNGIDNFQDPKHYVIWNMNLNTHILPEYVVSFRMTAKIKEYLIRNRSTYNMPGIENCGSSAPLHNNFSTVNLEGYRKPVSTSINQQNEKAIPLEASAVNNSSWMPFPTLRHAISSKISPREMDLLYHCLEKYKGKEINKTELIKSFKEIIGDQLLRSIIMQLKEQAARRASTSEPQPPES